MKPDTPPDFIDWRYVHPDGGEESYASEPRDIPTLRIERYGEIEYTRTNDKTVPIHWPHPRLKVRPPGDDWEQVELDPALPYSEWQRPARKWELQWP